MVVQGNNCLKLRNPIFKVDNLCMELIFGGKSLDNVSLVESKVHAT